MQVDVLLGVTFSHDCLHMVRDMLLYRGQIRRVWIFFEMDPTNRLARLRRLLIMGWWLLFVAKILSHALPCSPNDWKQRNGSSKCAWSNRDDPSAPINIHTKCSDFWWYSNAYLSHSKEIGKLLRKIRCSQLSNGYNRIAQSYTRWRSRLPEKNLNNKRPVARNGRVSRLYSPKSESKSPKQSIFWQPWEESCNRTFDNA